MRTGHFPRIYLSFRTGWFLFFAGIAANACSSESASKINVGSGGTGPAKGGGGGISIFLGGASGNGSGGIIPITTGGTSGIIISGGANSWGTAGAGGSGIAGGFGCPTEPSACHDQKDNDGDGKVDATDPECVGPCDNDEGSFATGISGDNVDACKQDCFFDGNSGQGDDGCDWNLKCMDATVLGAVPFLTRARRSACSYPPHAAKRRLAIR